MDCDCLLPSTAEQCWSRHLRAQEAFSLLKTCLLPIARLSKSKCYCHVVSIMCLQWAAHNELSAVVHMSPLVKNWQTCHALQIRCSWNVKIIIQLEVKLLTELKMSNFHDIKPAIPVTMTYLDKVTLQGIYMILNVQCYMPHLMFESIIITWLRWIDSLKIPWNATETSTLSTSSTTRLTSANIILSRTTNTS